jgi:hypothetical protein
LLQVTVLTIGGNAIPQALGKSEMIAQYLYTG